MTTRQEATQHATAWAIAADGNLHLALSAEGSRENLRAARHQREQALMWASVARLLPAVLDDEQLLRQQDEPPKHAQQCPSRHHFGHDGQGQVRCDRQHGHRGIHTTGGFQWTSTDHPNAATSTSLPGQRKAADTTTSTPTQPPSTRFGCCEQAIIDAASTLRQHARTAPGITAYERRCLEDAVDFITHHTTKAQPEPQREAPCDRWIAREAHPAHTFRDIDGPVRCPGVEPGGKGGQP